MNHFLRNKQKSISFRKQISTSTFELEDQSNYIYYTQLTEYIPKIKFVKKFFSTWTLSFLPSCIKEFALRRITNRYKLNSQITYFHYDISPICSFCKFFPLTNIAKETNYHLFYECPIVHEIINKYFSLNFHPELNIRNITFLGHDANTNFECIYVNIEIEIYYTYSLKECAF